MARAKSQAEIYSARLNPINPEEAAVIEIIKKHRQPGLCFKDMVVEAFLEREGFEPYLFQREPQAQAIDRDDIEELLRQFAADIIGQLKTGGFRAGNAHISEETDDNAQEITANLARGFMARRKGGK